jgi:hypothetical protein
MNLTLLQDGPLNTELADSDGLVVYKVITPFGFTNRTTTISRVLPNHHGLTVNMTELAQIHWRIIGSDILNYNGMEIAMKEYLHSKSIFSSG